MGDMQLDWGIIGVVLTIVFGIIGIIMYSKKNIIIVKPKNKNGDNNFSNTEITNEKFEHKVKK